ncbi:carbamoyltransferase HypF [bacterium BMS3Abin01]|nr:carbamoyltransferase HypF [bacterium BMS3Abin01]HDY69740.1 carbamoyltransferase HypF [Actinomycetota bacterium]
MSSTEQSVSGIMRIAVFVTGIVQGVGFRPFIYRIASDAGLSGFVLNTSEGVEIEVEGPGDIIDAFVDAVRRQAPPLSRITGLDTAPAVPTGETGFSIRPSSRLPGKHQLVSPDSCTCDDCLAEMRDPDDRRFGYPFINCTNCGPRFTIIEGLPYDRQLTTMRKFTMCPRCRAEYEDPADRRFHAEPNACPECGPGLWLAGNSGTVMTADDPIAAGAAALNEGMVLAIKGLGGFQLACLATDEDAVRRLRRRKRRPRKPFALMAVSLDDIALNCRLSAAESDLLASPQRPIVLLDSLDGGDIAASVAPGLGHLGMMLPYTPIHFMLMDQVDGPLVMTSGNMSEEPICRTNTEAVSRLGGIADMFLLHNRGIRSTYDDSVLMVVDDQPLMIRRARGYAPLPVRLPHVSSEPILATGADLKNCFSLTSGDEAFVSQHIGDLENAETLFHLEYTEALYEQLFDTTPTRFVCDRHPGYLSTAYCLEHSPSPLKVQHHRAHVASCLADNSYRGRALGVAMDGTGFGDDGLIWGGEFFSGSIDEGFERLAHLDSFPLLGGEAAIHEPWRTALALTWQYAPDSVDYVCDRFRVAGPRKELLLRQLEGGLNCPRTSSCGRLFDAVAALSLGSTDVSYEAQAAMELEAAASKATEDIGDALLNKFQSLPYRFTLEIREHPWRLSPARLISRLMEDLQRDAGVGHIALQFHLALADSIIRVCERLAERESLDTAALSGGCFQNRLLLRLVTGGLRQRGITVLIHKQVPPNDGGISLGQAAIAASR